MSSPTTVATVFHGADEPSLRDALTAFVAEYSPDPTTDLNLTRFDGRTVTLGDVENAAGALPFLADVRLVLIENLSEHPQAKAIVTEELAPMLTRLPDWARVVFIETGAHNQPGDSYSEQKRKGSRRKLIKKLIGTVEGDPRGRVLSFTVPDKPNERAKWLTERVKMHNATIERDAARLLAERVGQDLTLLNNELIKLATYTNGERAITTHDVDLLTPYEPEIDIFPLMDAIGMRNGKQALDMLRSLLREENQAPLQIYAMIIRQYRLMLQVKEQLERGHSPDGIAKRMKIHPYVAKKLSGQSRRYSLKLLERIYEILLEIDVEIKTGVQKDHQLALEVLIARLSR
jgi:DNA polymerase-3 subunit delta